MNANGGVLLQPFERRHAIRTLAWTNDPELSALLNRVRAVAADEHERWFTNLHDRDDTKFFAIELEPDRRHVGNVWLADIDRRHRKAEVRIIVGERDAMNRGVGTAALDLAARHAFDVLALHRVYAYVLALNPRARRSFEKAGFTLEGTLRDDRWSIDRFVDVFVLGRMAAPGVPAHA
jgi:RimJ/RimL family protein N-acetyltransferase